MVFDSKVETTWLNKREIKMQKQTPTSLFFWKLKDESHERKTYSYIFKKQRDALNLRLNPNLHAYKSTTHSFLLFLYECKIKYSLQTNACK